MAIVGGRFLKNTSDELVWHTTATGGFHLTDANNVTTQVVSELIIQDIYWTGQWVLARGISNTVIDTPAASSGHWNMDLEGIPMNVGEPGANVVMTLTGSGSMIIKFDKEASG